MNDRYVIQHLVAHNGEADTALHEPFCRAWWYRPSLMIDRSTEDECIAWMEQIEARESDLWK